MYVCRLFHRSQPFEQVDARLLASGQVSIGRDPAADWPLDDPEGLLSRLHCTLEVEDGRLLLRDRSTNGTFLGSGERVPRDVPVPIALNEMLRLGGLNILIDAPAVAADDELDRTAMLDTHPAAPPAAEIPLAPRADLLGAFCEGAGLDVALLAGEDPADLMRRAGQVYRETVRGLALVLADRSRLKADAALDRTIISSRENNPFKWAAPDALARDLLGAGDEAFLAADAAVRASFADLATHLAATQAGHAAAIAAVLKALTPAELDREAGGFSLKSRDTRRIEALERTLTALAASHEDGPAAVAFREAYRARARDGGAA